GMGIASPPPCARPGTPPRAAGGWLRCGAALPEPAPRNPPRGRAAGVRTNRWRRRTRPALRAGAGWANSSAEPGQCLGLDLFPRDGRLRIRPVGGQAAVHLLPLGLRQRSLLRLGGDAVPDFLNQGDPFGHAEPVDAEGL